ncbi:MAG: cation diffusion facilitator family transporter [Gammaproteobacteria bacterium]|nr:cation diffusion facilitator family transporter [Gammaproteobacteria bacterium]
MKGVESRSERFVVIRRVTLIGSWVDGLLGVGKLIVGWLAQSNALLADGVHSLSDLATDVMVLFAARHTSAEADDEHPYGHDRIETLATVVLGVSLIAVGVAIGVDACSRILNPDDLLKPEPWAIWIACVCVVAKEAMYHYTMYYARRLHSTLMQANAWHSRTDAISSLVVIAGLLVTAAGFPFVDAAAAIIVAAMIARIGWSFAWRGGQELVDTGLNEQTLEAIRATILAIDGVGSLHELRTRKMGSRALVDVHITLTDPRVSVSEGHQISETVRFSIIKRLADVSDVMVHIDPEDDEVNPPSVSLPLRRELLQALESCWAHVDGVDAIEYLTLHYLAGRVHLDVHVPVRMLREPHRAARFVKALRQGAEVLRAVGHVRLITTYEAAHRDDL